MGAVSDYQSGRHRLRNGSGHRGTKLNRGSHTPPSPIHVGFVVTEISSPEPLLQIQVYQTVIVVLLSLLVE